MRISKRQQVSLREVWPLETSFSDWLVSEAGLSLIAEDIGIEVEDPRRECRPGDFRCDVVGHALGDENHVIVIENQYGKTDHDHLGKMLTYAAVHAATTGIWLTERVSEDHRQVIDWLNNITPPNVNFFLAEIKAYRIDDSPVAPQLDVVCRPNLEVKSTRENISEVEKEGRHWRKELWEDVLNYIKEQNPPFNVQSPGSGQWTAIALGRGGFFVGLLLLQSQGKICCDLVMNPPWKEAAFAQIERDKAAIEAELGAALEWINNPNVGLARLRLTTDLDPRNDTDREAIKKWMYEKAVLFHRVFAPRVRSLQTSIDSIAIDQGEI